MKRIVKPTKSKRVLLAAMVCMIAASSISAWAVPPGQVYRNYNTQQFRGLCCASWGDTVSVTEPSTVQPVVVTWSAEYNTDGFDDFYVGLSLNGGPCLAHGPRSIFVDTSQPPRSFPQSITFQWVVLPVDGLVRGKNTFTVCGGAESDLGSIIWLGIRTLSVRFSK